MSGGEKMKKTRIIGLICILLIISFAITSAFSEVKSERTCGEELLIEIFKKSNATILETNIYTSLYLEDEYFKPEEMMSILDDLITHLDLKNQITNIVIEEYKEEYNENYEEELFDHNVNTLYITKLSDKDFDKVYATYSDENGNLSTFIVHSFEYDSKSESYIIVDILQNKSYKDMVSLLNKSNEFFSKYGETIDTTTTLKGAINGKLSKNETNKLIKKLLRNVNGEVVERAEDDFYTSVAAYTPYLQKAIQFFSNTVNLHMATRYNSHEDVTYIWIATPLITTTY